MLVVISDLHFEEEASDVIPASNNGPAIVYSRNINPRAYHRFVAQLAREARRNRARRIDLVLAGDILDLSRTSLWFEGGSSVRPYDASATEVAPGSPLEGKVLEILDAIAQEPDVADSLKAFELISRGRYRMDPGRQDSEEAEFPPLDAIDLHYLPGNHDRLADSTASVRRKVRSLLSLPGVAEPFPHYFHFEDPRALIRHGHEYDPYNFSVDHRTSELLPAALPEEEYADPAFGNFVTVDIAARLPVLFREMHTARGHDIPGDPVLRTVYQRLLDFDDLRPQSALMDFLLTTPGHDQNEVWRVLEPVVRHLLEEIHDHPFLLAWLRRYDRPGLPDVVDLVQLLLGWDALRRRIPLDWMRRMSDWISRRGSGPGPVALAEKEALVRDASVRFVVAGHSHNPGIEVIGSGCASAEFGTAGTSRGGGLRPAPGGEAQYYVDTGTWRNRILSSLNRKAFGRLDALTYSILYRSDEDRGGDSQRAKQESLDYWSGFTQRW